MSGGALDLEVTRRCNLRCDYCFVGWSRDWTSSIPRETALAIVEDGAGEFSTLHLTGGEPFAYEPLFDVIERAFACGYSRVMINTNGTMLTDERVARLKSWAGRISLSVSLDGPEAVHDAARGEGRFAEALDALRRLHAAGLEAHVMTVVTPEVLRALPAFLADLFDTLPALSGVTLFPVGVGPTHTHKPGAKLRPLVPDELKQLCFAVAMAERLGMPTSIGAYPIANPILLSLGYPRERLYQCTAGRGRMCVHANLDVSTCHPVKEAVYGRWRPGLLRGLGAFPEHRRFAERDYDGCRTCEHKEDCGHCRAFVTSSGQELFGNDEICHEVLDRPRPARSPGARVRLPLFAGAA